MVNYTPANANLLVNSCVGVDAPPGSAVSLPPQWEGTRQMYGYWTIDTIAGPISTRTPRLGTSNPFAYGSLCNPSWWNINIWGVEFCQDVIADGVTPIPMLSSGGLLDVGRRSTHVKARISYETMDVPRVIDVDIGTGIQLSVNTTSVGVKILAPDQSFDPAALAPGENPPPSRARGLGGGMQYIGSAVQAEALLSPSTGMVINAVVGASIKPCFSPGPGQHEATYTENVAIAAGEVGVPYAIPSAAKRVTIFSKDGVLDPWCFTHCSTVIANVDFGNGPTPTSVTVPIPQTAAFLQSPLVGPAADAGFVLIWHLEI